MKLEPITKLDKRKHEKISKNGDDLMSANYDAIDIFLIYG